VFEWFRRRTSHLAALSQAPILAEATSNACGKYQPLHKYLKGRFASAVVLKMSEIEDLLGFSLPAPARAERDWWTAADPHTAEGDYSRAWTRASRTAEPNLAAGTVMFERKGTADRRGVRHSASADDGGHRMRGPNRGEEGSDHGRQRRQERQAEESAAAGEETEGQGTTEDRQRAATNPCG
jgi:hypothetical protein